MERTNYIKYHFVTSLSSPIGLLLHPPPGGLLKYFLPVKDAGFITLNIDLIQMGVGGNDSWSDVAVPLEQYQIRAKDYHYSFYLVPANASKSTIFDIVKKVKLL